MKKIPQQEKLSSSEPDEFYEMVKAELTSILQTSLKN